MRLPATVRVSELVRPDSLKNSSLQRDMHKHGALQTDAADGLCQSNLERLCAGSG